MAARSRLLRSVLLCLLALSALGRGAASAQSDCAYALIDEVNNLRASYGLAPFTVDPILMAVVQTQTDYRVATGGAYGHLGPYGERPRDRAGAAGYGAGRTFFLSENVIQGTGLTIPEAVQWWTGDEPHLNTMIGQYYRDIGAGCGFSGDTAYYTINTGYVAGGYSSSGYYTTPAAEVPTLAPFYLSTPAPDGSVVHTVAAGQTLWTIAAYYDVDINVLRALNGFGETPILHPGDEVIVRAPQGSPTPSPAAIQVTRTHTAPPATIRPTAATTSPPESEGDLPPERSNLSVVLISIGAVLAIGGAVLAIRRS
jgi:LysM repeat protein